MATLHKIESVEHKRALLRLARDTARAALGCPASDSTTSPRIDGRFGGAFVTFWSGKRLRGCVGSFACTEDISDTIQQMTRRSLGDTRFVDDPITAAELDDVEIEISILSALEVVTNPLSLRPGVDGIMIRQGEKSGCFLPKVAAENGWSAEEFLSSCCTMKAGLPAGAWRKRDAEVSFFTADVFTESDFF